MTIEPVDICDKCIHNKVCIFDGQVREEIRKFQQLLNDNAFSHCGIVLYQCKHFRSKHHPMGIEQVLLFHTDGYTPF